MCIYFILLIWLGLYIMNFYSLQKQRKSNMFYLNLMHFDQS
jgi:hypothetical protein